MKDLQEMRKIKVLIEGMTSIIGGRETYIMTQYKCIDDSIFHYDFIFCQKKDNFPENYRKEIDKRGGKIFYIRNQDAWEDFLSSHTDYDFFISNTLSISSFIHKGLHKYPNSFKHTIIHSHIARKYPFRGFDKIEHRYELFLWNKLYSFGTKEWACSDIAGKWLFGDNAKFEIIKNGIFTEQFIFNETWRREIRDEFDIHESTFVVGNVGRVCSQKNQKYLIDIFVKLKASIPTAKLFLVGAFQSKLLYKYLKAKVRSYHLESDVFFAGERKDVYKFYSAFDIFAFPSKYEGLGIVGLEAEAAGLPCLFSDAVPETVNVRKSYCRFLPITRDGIDEWEKAIIDVYNDKDRIKLRAKSESADIIAEAGYDVRQETKRVENLLISYLDKDRRKSLGL